MAKHKFEKAHASWPKTELTGDGGVRVIGKYYPPDYGALDKFLGFCAAFAALSFAINAGDPMAGVALFICYALFYFFFLIFVLMWLNVSRLDIKIYPDRIVVLGKNYAREMPTEFRVEQHEKAQEEERAEMRAGQRKARTYRDAVQAVMQYGEKRVVLVSLKASQIEMANALVIRMQNVCANFGAAMQVAASQTSRAAPAGEFGPAPDIS